MEAEFLADGGGVIAEVGIMGEGDVTRWVGRRREFEVDVPVGVRDPEGVGSEEWSRRGREYERVRVRGGAGRVGGPA